MNQLKGNTRPDICRLDGSDRLGEETAHGAKLRVALIDNLPFPQRRQFLQGPPQFGAQQFGRGVPIFLGPARRLGNDTIDQAQAMQVLGRQFRAAAASSALPESLQMIAAQLSGEMTL